jgi:Bys1 family protein
LKAGQKGAAIPWIKNGQGTSVKIAKDSSFGKILQVEYTFTGPTLFWDLSNLDGSGASITGTPFAGDNVKISPSGAGVGSGTCKAIKCTADKTCADAYQHPDDTATKVSFLLRA